MAAMEEKETVVEDTPAEEEEEHKSEEEMEFEFTKGEEEEAAEDEGLYVVSKDAEAEEEAIVTNFATPVANNALGSDGDVNTASLGELVIDEFGIGAVNDTWKAFISVAESREAAGEAIYSALMDSAPSLQSLFVTPRAVQAMKFMNSIANFVTNLEDPPQLKLLVETLGFGHLHLDVTVPRVVIFRDAILDVFSVELGDKFTTAARNAWTKLLNYIGGAIIFVKANYAERINTLLDSWKVATAGKKAVATTSADSGSDSGEAAVKEAAALAATQKAEELAKQKKGMFGFGKTGNAGAGVAGAEGEEGVQAGAGQMSANQVPTTYMEMFRFNSAVMGFGTSPWMQEVLACFHNIVTNVANSARLQEECDVLVLRISKVAKGKVNFGEYKSCMLASLRSLLPKDWSTLHEVSWSWLWENVERIMVQNMGKTGKWEKALAKFLGGLDENQAFEMRKDIYNRFFAAAPAGQDFFKQSNTYLHFIADRVINTTLDLYKDPVKLVDDISAMGLRHVGYGIPTEFFGPYVSVACEVVTTITTDMDAIEGFRWSLGLVAKMTVRTILEGSTIVMKAINSNNTKQLRKALQCAPRGERAGWALTVQVGTQSISPLAWSIESGAFEAAGAVIQDLLTIRADRDRYYYGMDDLFGRHADVIQMLAKAAPTLLPGLLDGLIWRSTSSENGLRRANYYIRHLLLDTKGGFSPTLSWIVQTNDPRLVCHPIVVLLSDTVWNRLARRAFLWRKSWLLFTCIIFVSAQSVVKHLDVGNDEEALKRENYVLFALHAFIYVFNLTQLLWSHMSKIFKAYRNGDTIRLFGKVPVPKYMANWQDFCSFGLMWMLIVMLILEPFLWCLGDVGEITQYCAHGVEYKFGYSVFSMLAMYLYYVLLIDLAVVSTKVSAYVLVCMRMLSEVGLFILALLSVMLSFASAVSCIHHEQHDFAGIDKGMLTLIEAVMRMYGGKTFEGYESDPLVLVCVFVFLIISVVFLLNMLVAQLTCAYEAVYVDMLGYARIERVDIIVGTMPSVPKRRWHGFLNQIKLHEKTEFNAGDLGVTGGLQIYEPSNANPTTQDMIRRFGGSTAVENVWPADQEGVGDENDRFDRMEALIQRTLKRLTKGQGGGSGGGSRSGTGQSGSGSGGQGSGSGSAGGEEVKTASSEE